MDTMLSLMYITNRPEIALIAEDAGVDWIFVDMEFIGKDTRQGGLDTVQNHHSIEDVKRIKTVVNKAKVLVRVNPIHEVLPDYPSSKDEINAVIEAGADIIMLPYFKTKEEVEQFISIVSGRVKICLLLETPEAAKILDEIIEIPGIDMIYIGLNDMHLALGMKFMFELLANGAVDNWIKTIKKKNIKFGFGGLASLDGGLIPGRMILKEHYRLGSEMVIVSRAFCNTDKISNLEEIRKTFAKGINDIRSLEGEIKDMQDIDFEHNHSEVVTAVSKIIS